MCSALAHSANTMCSTLTHSANTMCSTLDNARKITTKTDKLQTYNKTKKLKRANKFKKAPQILTYAKNNICSNKKHIRRKFRRVQKVPQCLKITKTVIFVHGRRTK